MDNYLLRDEKVQLPPFATVMLGMCKRCGCLVGGAERHDKWHEQLESKGE